MEFRIINFTLRPLLSPNKISLVSSGWSVRRTEEHISFFLWNQDYRRSVSSQPFYSLTFDTVMKDKIHSEKKIMQPALVEIKLAKITN
jgi:hypothetical protein